MVYHIKSGDKIMVDFITRATMGKPGFLGCRPIEHTYEFKWVLRTEFVLPNTNCRLLKTNLTNRTFNTK